MREKKTIKDRTWLPIKSMGTVVLFFASMLTVLWAAIALVRFFLGAS